MIYNINNRPLCIKCEKRFVSVLRANKGLKLCSSCAGFIKIELKRKGLNKKTLEPIYFTRNCKYCNKEFQGNKKKKYCCKDCAKKADEEYRKAYFKSKEYKKRRKIQRKSPFENKKCVICNKLFETDNKKTVCCSDKCRKLRLCEQSREYYWRVKKELK